MTPTPVPAKRLLPILAFSLLPFAPVRAASIDRITVFAKGTDVQANSPDSLTMANGNLWLAYTNGADSTGASGSSLVVQYDPNGKSLRM